MEIPTARVLDDGVIRLNLAQALPYRWCTGAMGISPGVEFSGRLTELANVPVAFPGQSTFRDKAVDLKHRIIPETKWLPALAVGYHGLFGTQLLEAQCTVFNRQIYPFDFTLGYGRKRLDDPFAGVEVALHPRIHFVAEYNPIDHEKGGKAPARAIPEACQLILQAGTMGEGGEIFILDMGTPVKIVDMAKDLIRLSGFEPDVDIPIEFIGLRPGEKLYEELITQGKGILPTSHEKILVLRGAPCDPSLLNGTIEELSRLCQEQDGDGIKAKLGQIVEDYMPSRPGERGVS